MLSDRIGARLPVFLGVVAMGIASFGFANLALDTPVLMIAALVAIQGFGNGLALTPNAVAGMNALPQRLLARGTAIRSTVRQVGSSFSIAILTAFLVSRIGSLAPPATPAEAMSQQAGYNAVFMVVTLLSIACLALAAWGVPDSEEMAANVSARVEERDRAAAGD
jgi:MFS family permease